MFKNISKTFIVLLLLPFLVNAQGLSDNGIEIVTSPTYPRAGDTLNITIYSNTLSLDILMIGWSKGEKLIKEGIGERTYETKVGKLGSSETIFVNVLRGDGEFVRKSINIRPANVSLIWEADSYTPPLYLGKGLASHQSAVRVVAIPSLVDSSGNKLSSSNLFYEWSVDGSVVGPQSGRGKNVFSFTGPLTSRPKSLSLIVSSADGSLVARGTETVKFVNPEVIVYEENPLTGLRNENSLIVGNVNSVEKTFIVEPYFFSRNAFDTGLLNYEWRSGGNKLDFLKKSKWITFSGETSGRSSVSIRVINPSTILQMASAVFSVVVSR